MVKGGQSSALLKERHAIDKMLMLIQATGQHIEIVDNIGAEHTSKILCMSKMVLKDQHAI